MRPLLEWIVFRSSRGRNVVKGRRQGVGVPPRADSNVFLVIASAAVSSRRDFMERINSLYYISFSWSCLAGKYKGFTADPRCDQFLIFSVSKALCLIPS